MLHPIFSTDYKLGVRNNCSTVIASDGNQTYIPITFVYYSLFHNTDLLTNSKSTICHVYIYLHFTYTYEVPTYRRSYSFMYRIQNDLHLGLHTINGEKISLVLAARSAQMCSMSRTAGMRLIYRGRSSCSSAQMAQDALNEIYKTTSNHLSLIFRFPLLDILWRYWLICR